MKPCQHGPRFVSARKLRNGRERHHHSYPDRATARRSIFEWLIGYNTHRLHTSLGNQTPDDYEHHYRHTAGTKPTLTT